ncbi:MAG: 5-formyltetrahydrofolate cyclo-ligase [Actinobacteria bacterium]|nr:5-formyltetrahydrofolate cyclo-ligase [Actinomycetota bacterium]
MSRTKILGKLRKLRSSEEHQSDYCDDEPFVSTKHAPRLPLSPRKWASQQEALNPGIILSVTDGAETRTELRKRLRDQRRQLTPEQRAVAQDAAAQRLEKFLGSQPPGLLGTYMPTDGELDINQTLDALRDLGWRIFLPVLQADLQMGFAEWVATETLQPNKFGILEPAAPAELLSASSLDVVVVPCVGLDESGNRLGFGAGYYDRAFSGKVAGTERRTLLVGCAFDLQFVQGLAAEPWDVPMKYILTESKLRPVTTPTLE